MKPQSLAARLLLFLMLLSPVSAQNVSSNGPNTGTPVADSTKKPDTNSAPAPTAGELQQKQEAPPPQVAGLAPRRAEAPAEPGQTNIEIKYDVQGVSVQGNTDRSFLHACTSVQMLAFTPPARPRVCDSINTTTEVSFLNNVPFFGSYRLETSLVERYTDNPRVDPERISLQRGYLRLASKDMEATLGDSLVNYSRLSFSQNIKGLHAWRQWTDKVKITGTVGYFADRWGSLYRGFSSFRDITLDCLRASTIGTPPPPGPPFAAAGGCIEQPPNSQNFVVSPANPFKPYTRLVAGVRLERKAGKTGWAAINWSHGRDLRRSLSEAFVTCTDTTPEARRIIPIGIGCTSPATEITQGRLPAPEASDNHVVSFDTSLDLHPLRLKVLGEIARGWTVGGIPPVSATNNPASFACPSQAPVFGGAVLDARCFTGHVADNAYRAEVSQRIGKLSWRTDYSRFQPNFSSTNARQIRDLQDFNARGDYQFMRQFGMTLSWRRSNDNLNGKRNFTNVVRAPEVRLTFRDLPFYRKFVLEVGYRERNLDTTGNPEVTCQTTPATTPAPKRPAHPGCLPTEVQSATEERFRSTRIPFFSLTLPVKDTQVSFDYEHRHDMDAVVNQNSTDTDRFAFGYRGNYTWNNWDVIPSFRFELERLAKLTPNNAALSLTDPSLIFPIDFFTGRDTSRSFNAQLQIEAPRYVRFEGVYREFNSIALSALKASILLDPLQRFFYLNQGFKRPSWRASMTYKIKNGEDRLITAYYERGNNFFNTGDPFAGDSKSFRETIIGGTILLRFRH